MIKNIVARFSTLAQSRLFLFAGQGSQEVGMFGSIPEKDREEGVAVAREAIGIDLGEVAATDEKNRINQTEITQPLLLLSHYLHFRKDRYHLTLEQDDWMIGHSLG